jgi:hypothetical protein
LQQVDDQIEDRRPYHVRDENVPKTEHHRPVPRSEGPALQRTP